MPPPSRWLVVATGLVALVGLGLSVYLTITHLNPKTLFCSSHGIVNCEAVTQSTQSKVFGIFPVAELGLGFYVFMTAICTPWAWRMKRVLRLGPVRIGNQELRWIRLGSVIVGIGFVLYLLFVELIQLGSICLYCTGVHIATFLLFVLILFDSVFRQAPAYTTAPASAKRTKG
ncbi:MAG: vitamin K epoxide reductase family protein [Actinomycetota bacterium]|nr:vitamin K epoxide reductase family protein [Actinomycetota bacterium]